MPAALPPDAEAALRAGRKIEAIKIVREQRGLGLREAKELVERYEAQTPVAEQNGQPGQQHAARSFTDPTDPKLPVVLPPEAAAALRAGNKIEAIKIVREQRGLGLRESKELVERYEAQDPGLARTAHVARGSCLIFLAALTAMGAAACAFIAQ